MASRVVISRLGQVGAVLRSNHRPYVCGLPTIWNRTYSQDTDQTGPSDPVGKSTSAMNATWMKKNLFADSIVPVTETFICPMRPWLLEAAGEWIKYTHMYHIQQAKT